MHLRPMTRGDLPPVLPFRKLLGPSFILLGLGLGSGEILLWPYLTSQWGMGVIWGAVLGITFQFFLNMEIERYTLINGESVFVGLARKFKVLSPVWFILATLIPWMWPGIIMSSAAIFAHVIGGNDQVITIVLLLIIGAILTLGPVIYKTQETFQKVLVYVGVPLIIVLSLVLSDGFDIQSLLNGIVGIGDGYRFLPKDIALLSFLSAFAYSGAGGTLNLAQSFYIKEKGYGMGKYGGRITSLLTGKSETITLEGKRFDATPSNLKKFSQWWSSINREHMIVFWLTGGLSIIALSLLSFSTVYGHSQPEGLGFIFYEASAIAAQTLPFIGTAFLIVAACMLFSTQLTILDASSRIMSENLVIIDQSRFKINHLPKYYYLFLWLLIFLGICITVVGLPQPLYLVSLGAVLNGFSMLIYSIAVLYLNMSDPIPALRPSWIRIFFLLAEIGFFSYFCTLFIRQIFM